jgi:hypothetical protein
MLRKVSKKELYHCCEPKELPFKTTDDISPLTDLISTYSVKAAQAK